MDTMEQDVMHDVIRHLTYWLGRATYEHWRALSWYDDMHEEMRSLSKRYNTPLNTTCAVTAVLSPNIEWSVNVRAAEGILATGERLMLNGKRTPGYNRNTEKALEIYKTDDVSLVTGKKVPHFYNSLLDPVTYSHVTVDQWMARAAGFILDWKTGPGVRVIRVVQAAVTTIARRRGKNPPQIQAVVWSSIKDHKDWKQQCELLGPVTIGG